MPRRNVHTQRQSKKRSSARATSTGPRENRQQRDTSRTQVTTPTNATGLPIATGATTARRSVRPYQAGVATSRARTPSRSVFALSRAQEYAFIREDMRRLLLTSGVLVVVMIALLFLIDR
jgi:hypothetical protein